MRRRRAKAAAMQHEVSAEPASVIDLSAPPRAALGTKAESSAGLENERIGSREDDSPVYSPVSA